MPGMDALAFLERAAKSQPLPIYVLHGDEDFLKRQVLAALQTVILGSGDSFGLSTHAGDKATYAAVHDELQTLPFLAPRRLVVVEQADPFVSEHRALLEKYVTAPAPSGTLVLDVKTWPATTKLAKMLDSNATIVCKELPPAKLPEWCIGWAGRQYQKQLAAPAARLLVDLVGSELGLLDQELAKLATYAGKSERIELNDVDTLVGRSRTQDAWKIFDAIGNGQPKEALGILERLLDQGENPIGLLGAFSWQLRPLAQAYRMNQLGRSLAAAMAEAGIPPFRLRSAEQLLRHLGRRRAEFLYDWLLETDLGLKGSSALPERTQLERLVVRLSMARVAN